MEKNKGHTKNWSLNITMMLGHNHDQLTCNRNKVQNCLQKLYDDLYTQQDQSQYTIHI